VIDSAKVTRYANLIKAVCKQARTVSTTAVVSLPVSAVFHTIVNLPIVKKEEVDALLKAEIRKLLPYKLEETALDYELLPRPADAKDQPVFLLFAMPDEFLPRPEPYPSCVILCRNRHAMLQRVPLVLVEHDE
jgi:Tfp pilus assembly PilM family ATPase